VHAVRVVDVERLAKTLVSQVEPLVCVEEQRHPDQSGHDDATATSRGTRSVHHQRTLLVGRATQQLNLRRRAQTASMPQRKIDNIRHAVENESVRRRNSKPHVARKTVFVHQLVICIARQHARRCKKASQPTTQERGVVERHNVHEIINVAPSQCTSARPRTRRAH
jgi:hypothetical protein